MFVYLLIFVSTLCIDDNFEVMDLPSPKNWKPDNAEPWRIFFSEKMKYSGQLKPVTTNFVLEGSWGLPQESSGRIIGGVNVGINRVPYQVSIQNRGEHFCGGALVGNRWILTAAHCVSLKRPRNLKIHVGSGKLYKVEAYMRHEKYSYFTMDYDVAVIKLAKPVQTGPAVSIIPMAKDNDEFKDGALATATEWKNISEDNFSETRLQKFLIPVINQKKCSESNKKFGKITPRMLCAGTAADIPDACEDDSGGPLVIRDTLVGIVSWGVNSATPGYTGVYSRVSKLRGWIDKTMKTL